MSDETYFIEGNFIKKQKLPENFVKNRITRYFGYCAFSIFFNFLIFLKSLIKGQNRFKYSVSICAIFKNESIFLKEWIDYHLTIGVEHFFLYNNNSSDNYLQVLEPYVSSGLVTLIDWPYQQGQMSAYKDCYDKNLSKTNWLGYIDMDEFVCPIKFKDIKSTLNQYKDYPSVAIYWKQFGSNGKLYHDNNELVIEQYTQCWEKYSVFTKVFCNMNFPIASFDDMHIFNSKIFGIIIPPINQFKNFICFGVNRVGKKQNNPIQINHYWGKAHDCFVKNKIERSDAFYKDNVQMGELRKKLLKSHEEMCTTRDYTIHRFLLETKLKYKN